MTWSCGAPLVGMLVAVIERSQSPTWDGVETRGRWVIVLFSLGAAAQLIGGVQWLIQYRRDRRMGVSAARKSATVLAGLLVTLAVLLAVAWSSLPFGWRFRLYRQQATKLATGAPGERFGGIVELGWGAMAISVETEAGPLYCTSWAGKHLAGILYHPGGALSRDPWARFSTWKHGPRRQMRVATCDALSPEWYAVTWTWGDEARHRSPDATAFPTDEARSESQPAKP
jgi:hypothetical protein